MQIKTFGWLLTVLGATLCIVAIVKFSIIGFYPSVVSDWIGYAIAGLAGLVCLRIGVSLADKK